MTHKTIKLSYRDAIGTFTEALIILNDDNQAENLLSLPCDLQEDIIQGVYDNAFCDFEERLLI